MDYFGCVNNLRVVRGAGVAPWESAGFSPRKPGDTRLGRCGLEGAAQPEDRSAGRRLRAPGLEAGGGIVLGGGVAGGLVAGDAVGHPFPEGGGLRFEALVAFADGLLAFC